MKKLGRRYVQDFSLRFESVNVLPPMKARVIVPIVPTAILEVSVSTKESPKIRAKEIIVTVILELRSVII